MDTRCRKGDEVMNLDFIVQLNKYINTFGLYAKSYVGLLQETDSISVMAMPGGTEEVFMNGARDKAYQVQINAKSKRQDECVGALNAIFTTLELTSDIPSANGSYDFENIEIVSLPSLITQDEQGYFIWQLSISCNITIYV